MSWLGGLNDRFNQFSSLTGQIGGQLSNFTKEVLTETPEENVDYEVEVKRLSELLRENESLIADLKHSNEALKERARKAELQLSTSETEWRDKLERQNCGVGNRVPLQNADRVGNSAFSSTFTTISLDHEEDEFHDIVTKQRQIEHLSAELDNARKKISKLEEKEKVAASVSGDVHRQNTDFTLQQRIQELEDGIRREAEHHRKEMQTMEDCNKAAILRYQEEIKKLKQVSSGDNDVDLMKSEQEYVLNVRKEMQHLQIELDDMKNQMRTRNRQLQAQKKQIDDLKVAAEEKKLKLDNFKHRESKHLESKNKWEDEASNLKSEIQAMNQQMTVVKKGMTAFVACYGHEWNGENVDACLENCIDQYRRTVKEKDSLLAANNELEMQIDVLKSNLEQVQEQAQAVPDWSNDNFKGSESPIVNKRRHFPPHLELGTPLGHSSPQISSAKRVLLPQNDDSTFPEPGDLTLTMQALQKQIEDYEKEIAEYERVQNEWRVEKESLQTLLNRYQDEMGEMTPRDQPDEVVDERAVALAKLKEEIAELQAVRGDLEKDFNRVVLEKDQFQSAAKKLESELNMSLSDVKSEKDSLRRELDDFAKEKEKLEAAYNILTRELNESRMEKDNLDEALETLDSQHQDEMNQLLIVRDDYKNQVKEMKSQLEAEKLIQNDLEKKLEKAERKACVKFQQYDETIVDKNEEIEGLRSNIDLMQTRMNELERSGKEAQESYETLQFEKTMLTEKIADLEDLVRKAPVDKEHVLQSGDENSHSLDQGNIIRQSASELTGDELDDKNRRIRDLEKSLKDKNEIIEKMVTERKAADIELTTEISRLQNEIENLGKELESSGKEFMKLQLEHEGQLTSLRTECDNKLTNTINKLRQSFEQEKDAFQNEADATNKVYQQKVVHFETLHSDSEKEVERVKLEILKTVKEKDILIENLKSQHSELSKSHQTLQNSFESMKNSLEKDRSVYSSKYKSQNDERNELEAECARLQTLLDKANSTEIALTNEASSLNLKIEKCNREINDLKANQHVLLQKESEKSAKISELLAEIERLKSEFGNSAHARLCDVSEELLSRLGSSDVVGVEKSDLSKDDVGSLLKLIKERDSTIESLKRATIVNASPEHEQLKNDYRSLSAEKDQILSVISEKTKENRKLKDEIHKMIGVVAESNAALEKVQNENNNLVKKYEGYDDEMTKEGISKLSRLVMEKDLEIESLQQKCGTLLEVLQQQSGGGNESAANMVSGEQVQILLKEKEILTSQVQQLLNERNQLVTLLNQSQIEMTAAKAEAFKAAEALEKDSDNNSKLQIGYSNLVHDYDQVQLKMASMQREFTALQDKFTDLERTKNYLCGKLEEFGITDAKTAEDSLQKKSSALEDITVESSTTETPHHDLTILHNDNREKDLLIHSRTEELKRVSKELSAKSNEVVILRRSVENLREQVGSLTKSCNESQGEVREVASKLDEKLSESRAFQETNAQLSMLLKEKEYELESLAEKCERLETVMKEQQQGTESEAQKYLHELDSSRQALIHVRHERDQVMLSLKQKKMEADKFAEEARNAIEKEGKLKSELERLTNHLIQVEEAYTQEAVLAEDRIASLQDQLGKAKSRQNAVRQAGEQYQQQVESLQEQLRTAIAQRDHMIHQLQLSQEQSIQYATTIQNLQIAVERMQREEAASFAEKVARLNAQLEAVSNDAKTYKAVADDLQIKLDNATDALKSASRLNAQLETKEESINHLKGIVAEKQLENDDLQNNLHILSSKAEAMVDKDILKNLFMGYFTTPTNQRQEVLRLISGVLGFSDDEIRKLASAGTDKGARAWIGGWLWRGGGATQNRQSASVPVTPRGQNANQSFTQMFVKFLETESVPHQTPRLPAAAMVSEAQQKRRPVSHSVPTPISPTRSEPVVAGRYSPYLLSSTPKGRDSITSNPVAITPMLLNFEPIINAKPSGEQEILQDILLNRGDG